MLTGWNRALRFGKGWKVGAAGVHETEVIIPTPVGSVPATLLIPSGSPDPLPGWVTLHGITRPGRHHPTLLRFVRALANSGAAVLVPEIPSWRELLLTPWDASQILKASVLALADRKEVHPYSLGAMGFSFGCPQVLMAGADPDLIPHLKVVTGFGGYGDMERTVRFLFRGEHEWEGEHHVVDPDPYGRWVVAGNFLTQATGYEECGDVAGALLRLAQYAGDIQVPSAELDFESIRGKLEEGIEASRRPLFRELGLGAGPKAPERLALELAPALAQAAFRISPLYDVLPKLSEVRVPVRLIHGRGDRLIPYTETLRVAEALPAETPRRAYLTGLFNHSQRDEGSDLFGEIGEMSRFLHMMADILGLL